MFGFLNQTYPFSFQPLRRIKQIIPIGVCVFLFLVLLKPFGIDNNPDYIFLAAYMVSWAAIAGIITTVLIPYSFPKYFNENKWTVKRNLLYILFLNIVFLLILFFASNAFVIIRYNSYHDFTIDKFLWYLRLQVLLGVPLGILVNFINQYYLLKKHLRIANSINTSVNKEDLDSRSKNSNKIHPSTIELDVDQYQKLSIDTNKLVLVEALGNYINIFYYDNEIKRLTIRETISNFEKKLSSSDFIFRSHRSYLINLQLICKIDGDSQGLKVHLKKCDRLIPVSRNKIKDFKSKLKETL